MSENKCKTCKYFEKQFWYDVIDPDEGPQLGGKCGMLTKVLSHTNSKLWWLDDLHIQESFGCVMHRRSDADDEPDTSEHPEKSPLEKQQDENSKRIEAILDLYSYLKDMIYEIKADGCSKCDPEPYSPDPEPKYNGQITCQRCGTSHPIGQPCHCVDEIEGISFDNVTNDYKICDCCGARRPDTSVICDECAGTCARCGEDITSESFPFCESCYYQSYNTNTDKIWMDAVKTIRYIFKDEQSKKVLDAIVNEVESRKSVRRASDETNKKMNELKKVIEKCKPVLMDGSNEKNDKI